MERILDRIKSKLKEITLWGLVTTAGIYVCHQALDGILSPYLSSYVIEPINVVVDRYTCGGVAELDLGDTLSQQAMAAPSEGEMANLLKDANAHYVNAYACRQPDAGLRLAAANCRGLGTARDRATAWRLIREVEEKYPAKAPRAQDVRRYCGFAST